MEAAQYALTLDEPKPAAEQLPPLCSASPLEIGLELAVGAFSAISFTPEKSGARVREDYAYGFNAMRDRLAILATTPEQTALLNEQLSTFKPRYRSAYCSWLAAMGRTMSPMITGPARFPVERNRKRCNTEHKRLEEMIELREKFEARIRRMLMPEHLRPVSSDRADAPAVLRDKAGTRQTELDRMKSVNASFRAAKTKTGGIEGALREIWPTLSEKEQNDVASNFKHGHGNVPYPSWAIRNARQRARSTEARAQAIENVAAIPSAEFSGDRANVLDNADENRVQVIFPAKPDREVIQELRRRGFVWSPTNGAWQRKRGTDALYWAKQIAGAR